MKSDIVRLIVVISIIIGAIFIGWGSNWKIGTGCGIIAIAIYR